MTRVAIAYDAARGLRLVPHGHRTRPARRHDLADRGLEVLVDRAQELLRREERLVVAHQQR